MNKEQAVVIDKPEVDISIDRLLESMKMGPLQQDALVPMISENLSKVNENVSNQTRFLSSLAAVLGNIEHGEGFLDRGKLQELIGRTNKMINDQINEVIHHPKFQRLESTWRGLLTCCKTPTSVPIL